MNDWRVPIRFIFVCASVALFSVSAPAEHAERIVRIANDQGSQIYINIAGPAAPESSPAPDLSSSAPEGIAQMVKREAREMRVDPQLVDAVIRVESGYNPRAVSSKGAMGLMQLIPATADRFGVRNPFDPAQNVAGGVSYLRYLLNLFHGNVPLSVAAYNAGEHLVLRTGRVPAIPETVNYVRKVTALYSVPDNKGGAAPTPEAPIVSAVDAQGVIHFSNDGAF